MLEMLSPALAKFLEQNGFSAIVIVVLSWTVYSLYKRNCLIQDQRLADYRTMQTFLEAATVAKVAQTITLEKLADLISRGGLSR